MAITKTIEIDVNSGGAVTGIDNITSAIEQTDNATKSLKAQLREAQLEVATLSDKFGATSEEAINAAKRAAELRDKIGDAKSLTDAFNPDAKFSALSQSLGGVASGFSAVEGGLSLVGVQSANLQEQMVKLQGVMALAQGLQGVGESIDSFKQLGAVIKSTTLFQKLSTAAQWLWNAAMSANPIGAIITAIVALIAAGYKLITWYQDSSEANEQAAAATKRNTKALEQQSKQAQESSDKLKTYNQYQYDLAKASGASAEELRKLALKHKDEEIALNQKNTMLARGTFLRERDTLAMLKNSDASDEVIAAQEKLTQETYKEFNKQRDNYYKSKDEKVALIRQQNVEIRQEETNARKEANDRLKEQRKTDAENRKKKEEEHKKELDDKLKREQQYRDDYLSLMADANERELQESYDLKQEQLAILDAGIAEETTANENKAAKDLEIEKAVADGKKAIQESTFSVVESGLGMLKGLFEKNKAIQKGLVIAESAVGIAKIVTSTQAANAADRAASSLMGPAGVPYLATKLTLNKIGAAIGIASNIAATAKALSALGGGGAGSGGSNGGTETASGSAPTPQFNVVGNTGVNQIAATLGQQQPVQAFVVANQVTTQQALDRNIVQNASIG